MPSTRNRRTLPRLAVAALLTALALAGCGGAEPGSDAPHRVFLVTIDTLRADHLSCLGYPRPVSPFIDRLAAEGTLFTRAFSASSTTITSHASLFTSLEPPQHQMIRNGVEMNDTVFTMAEMFRQHGYRTAGFSTVSFMRGVRDGFDVFDTEESYFPASHVTGKAVEWLESQPADAPLFVWIHLFDPHEWYQPRNVDERYQRLAAELEPNGEELARHLEENHGVVTELFDDREQLLTAIDRYDGQIMAVDAALEELYGFTAGAGSGEALWIVTSDHGEGLGSHAFKGHGARIFNEQIRVPLIFHFTDGRFGGQRVDRLVRHVDILPTLAELLGEPLEEQVFPVVGHSLMPLLRGRGVFPVRYAFAQRREADERRLRGGWEDGEVFSLQSERYKYIYHSESEDQFFDLERDPLERENLIDAGDPTAERMRDFVVEAQRIMSEQGEQLGRGEIQPEYVEQLKALGYL